MKDNAQVFTCLIINYEICFIGCNGFCLWRIWMETQVFSSVSLFLPACPYSGSWNNSISLLILLYIIQCDVLCSNWVIFGVIITYSELIKCSANVCHLLPCIPNPFSIFTLLVTSCTQITFYWPYWVRNATGDLEYFP